MHEKIIILDFGSQTTQLIGRRVRELNVYCEIVPYNKMPENDPSVIGVILSGSPFSVYDEKAFKIDLSEIRGKYPVLGICYGAQFISYVNGGKVEPAGTREYGRAHLSRIDKENPLLKGLSDNTQVWMSHGDTITAVPDNFEIIASTDKVAVAAYQVKPGCAEPVRHAFNQFAPHHGNTPARLQGEDDVVQIHVHVSIIVGLNLYAGSG